MSNIIHKIKFWYEISRKAVMQFERNQKKNHELYDICCSISFLWVNFKVHKSTFLWALTGTECTTTLALFQIAWRHRHSPRLPYASIQVTLPREKHCFIPLNPEKNETLRHNPERKASFPGSKKKEEVKCQPSVTTARIALDRTLVDNREFALLQASGSADLSRISVSGLCRWRRRFCVF